MLNGRTHNIFKIHQTSIFLQLSFLKKSCGSGWFRLYAPNVAPGIAPQKHALSLHGTKQTNIYFWQKGSSYDTQRSHTRSMWHLLHH